MKKALMLALCVAAGSADLAIAAQPDDADKDATAPANPATAQELPRVVIIATAPLPGIGLPPEQVAGNVQTAGSDDLKRQQSLSLSEYLNSNFTGVTASESSDNPFQTDINYHGFTASPLLGTPEGLSIFVDGVRVNEAFGDTVNWDLIPESAISNISLISGSNPVFGLNTLGGALAVQTKSGHDFPGTEVEAYGGSFGRRAFEAATGGSSGPFDYFLTGNYFDEDGWRNLSPSKVKQIFGKVGWENEVTDLDLSYTWADTALTGNGTTPQTMLALNREAIFTAPDFTNNKLNFVNATASHFLRPDLLLSGNVYYRHLTTLTNNGDLNDDNYLSEDYEGPDVDCGNFTSLSDVAYCANGINRASTTTQRTFGLGAQITSTHDLGPAKNQAVLGASYDRSTVDYVQAFQYATVTSTRQTLPIDSPFNPLETVNSVGGTSKVYGVYFTDTLSPTPLVHITASLRYNRIEETLDGYSVDTDVGDFGDGFNEAEPLFGDHTYSRVNPALGVTFTPSKALTLYANYNEGSRAPTVIELGCSDPEQPCGLPNDFASDPDLKQVVSRTVEAGARGSLPDNLLNWSFDVFRTENSNDIQFVATTTSEGYFANVGTTRRQGLDLGLGGRLQKLTWHLAYSFVDATYRSSFEVNAESNSTADDDGNITVNPGNRIPLIPRHTGRLRLDYALAEKWDVGASLLVSSGVFLHGDENNANVADGTDIIGSGHIGGYGVVNLDSTYHVSKAFDVFVKVANLFDNHYATAGFLTSNGFNPDGTFRPDPDTWTNENAVSPAQPLAIWAGVRLHFD
ncbi:MAG TPA: TonB-dependent receptor [Steroidobacteraceae bacterium]|nr:TonB-dependent receptor [Steroidobacteraceae bacterium]